MATEPNIPAERTDNIGNLARRLIGSEENPPDLTAAPLLYDEFMAEGDIQAAMALRREIGHMLPILMEITPGFDVRQRQRQLTGIQNALFQLLQPFLFDFTSTCGCLAAFVAEASNPAEAKKSEIKLETVRVPINEGVRRGMIVPIDAERSGIVVSDRGADGHADVMPMDEGGYGEGEGADAMPMGQSMGMFGGTTSGRWANAQARRFRG